jgi:hypothetical protein
MAARAHWFEDEDAPAPGSDAQDTAATPAIGEDAVAGEEQ